MIPVILLTADLTWLGRLLCLGMSVLPALILAAVSGLVKKHHVKTVTEAKN